jgi:hypothetical protein
MDQAVKKAEWTVCTNSASKISAGTWNIMRVKWRLATERISAMYLYRPLNRTFPCHYQTEEHKVGGMYYVCAYRKTFLFLYKNRLSTADCDLPYLFTFAHHTIWI